MKPVRHFKLLVKVSYLKKGNGLNLYALEDSLKKKSRKFFPIHTYHALTQLSSSGAEFSLMFTDDMEDRTITLFTRECISECIVGQWDHIEIDQILFDDREIPSYRSAGAHLVVSKHIRLRRRTSTLNAFQCSYRAHSCAGMAAHLPGLSGSPLPLAALTCGL
ncbi:Hypothetical protein Deide_13051 [Deinococcus deserti VCD115]|uniref:Uncharacterized protein n=1 Tax=Deinococcus deserti (strain DSM 17065 / CIP 109153 / LMG 22923 / VCD115) TaxID=546414 RepID=C1CVL2_DEIDV|nr:Hypothetical protein Deide_13051 [Deinococcus deserti VCD115]